MFKFNKPKKVFEKLNKMTRKQAYTIGAIVLVLVVVLIMLISSMMGGDDESFAGMNSRGYDLAQMPFATDAAEKYLLNNVYPDMKENGSSLLYGIMDKENRQDEDAAALSEGDEEEEDDEEEEGEGYGDDSKHDRAYGDDGYGGSGGYGGYGGRGGGGGTEIHSLSPSGMASAGGSGVNSVYGPSGDFHQFKGREDRGSERPVQLTTGDGRRALAQFRSGSNVAARLNENKLQNAGKALYGGNIKGSDAFGKDGSVDLSKLQEGGLTLDTSAPPTTSDLKNLDKKLSDAAKKAEDKKKQEDKKAWWQELLIDLAKTAAQQLLNTVMSGISDTIKGARASYLRGKAFDKGESVKSFGALDKRVQDQLIEEANGSYGEAAAEWENWNQKARENYVNRSAAHNSEKAMAMLEKIGSTPAPKEENQQQIGQRYCTPSDETACENREKKAVVKDGHCVCE